MVVVDHIQGEPEEPQFLYCNKSAVIDVGDVIAVVNCYFVYAVFKIL